MTVTTFFLISEQNLPKLVADLRDHYGTDYDTTVPGKEFDAEIGRIILRHATREESGQEGMREAFVKWWLGKDGDPASLTWNEGGNPHDADTDVWGTWQGWSNAWRIAASLGTTERTQPRICGKPTKWHLIAGYSQYACMKPRDHDGECLPGGTCMKHGTYVGFSDGIVRCPKWPDCIDWTILVTKPEAGRTPERTQDTKQTRYWIVEWSFKGKDVWSAVDRPPYQSEYAAGCYPRRDGFDYRVIELAGRTPETGETPAKGAINVGLENTRERTVQAASSGQRVFRDGDRLGNGRGDIRSDVLSLGAENPPATLKAEASSTEPAKCPTCSSTDGKRWCIAGLKGQPGHRFFHNPTMDDCIRCDNDSFHAPSVSKQEGRK